MGRFIQVIEFESSRYDEMKQLLDDMQARREAADSDGSGPIRGTQTQDRDRPGHYVHIVEFESYEAAMANSNHPETQEFAAKMAEL
ncbi:MAG TPA: hypothetical protein VJ831_06300, partial [Jatrophihabitantaceae bacterium]|nr:hypothetical protein [Jatrophihabitantaceae bacterium]